MAEVTLKIPTPLQPYTDGRRSIAVAADDVAGALDAAAAQHPALVRQIRSRDGAVRPYVNLFVRNTDIRELDGQHTALADGDEIVVMPSVAGGR